MYPRKKALYILAAAAMAVSCNSQKSDTVVSSKDSGAVAITTTVPAAKDTQATAAPVAAPASAAADAQFVFVVKGEDEGQPKSTISLKAGGKSTVINTIDGVAEKIGKEDYASKKIPAEAVDACGAFFADEGNYYYAIPDGKGFKVFEAWNDGRPDYPWKLKKTIN